MHSAAKCGLYFNLSPLQSHFTNTEARRRHLILPACLLFSAVLPGSKAGQPALMASRNIGRRSCRVERTLLCTRLPPPLPPPPPPPPVAPPPSLPPPLQSVCNLPTPARLNYRRGRCPTPWGGGPSKIALPACRARVADSRGQPPAPARICSCCSSAEACRVLRLAKARKLACESTDRARP